MKNAKDVKSKNDLIDHVTELEGKKESVSRAQVAEILRIVSEAVKANPLIKEILDK
jgi:hypothetical protein